MGTGWEEPGRDGGECGPSSISLRGLLSSHSQEEYTVRLGDTLLQSSSPNAVVIPVEDIICYSHYNSHTMRHDIALALLALSVNYSAYIQPVCLPGEDLEVKAGTLCWATGWGRTIQFGETGWQDLRGDIWCPGVGLQAEGSPWALPVSESVTLPCTDTCPCYC